MDTMLVVNFDRCRARTESFWSQGPRFGFLPRFDFGCGRGSTSRRRAIQVRTQMCPRDRRASERMRPVKVMPSASAGPMSDEFAYATSARTEISPGNPATSFTTEGTEHTENGGNFGNGTATFTGSAPFSVTSVFSVVKIAVAGPRGRSRGRRRRCRGPTWA